MAWAVVDVVAFTVGLSAIRLSAAARRQIDAARVSSARWDLSGAISFLFSLADGPGRAELHRLPEPARAPPPWADPESAGPGPAPPGTRPKKSRPGGEHPSAPSAPWHPDGPWPGTPRPQATRRRRRGGPNTPARTRPTRPDNPRPTTPTPLAAGRECGASPAGFCQSALSQVQVRSTSIMSPGRDGTGAGCPSTPDEQATAETANERYRVVARRFVRASPARMCYGKGVSHIRSGLGFASGWAHAGRCRWLAWRCRA